MPSNTHPSIQPTPTTSALRGCKTVPGTTTCSISLICCCSVRAMQYPLSGSQLQAQPATHRHGHVGPASVADLGARAARPDVVVVRQVDIEHQLSLHRLKCARLDREVVLWRGTAGDRGRLFGQEVALEIRTLLGGTLMNFMLAKRAYLSARRSHQRCSISDA